MKNKYHTEEQYLSKKRILPILEPLGQYTNSTILDSSNTRDVLWYVSYTYIVKDMASGYLQLSLLPCFHYILKNDAILVDCCCFRASKKTFSLLTVDVYYHGQDYNRPECIYNSYYSNGVPAMFTSWCCSAER